jgi:hypothetical protein
VKINKTFDFAANFCLSNTTFFQKERYPQKRKFIHCFPIPKEMTMFLYTKGEMVWAKIKNFPWWPAYVIETLRGGAEEEIHVSFINIDMKARLTNNKVGNFKKYFKKYFNPKNPELVEATDLAHNIITNKTTFANASKLWLSNKKQTSGNHKTPLAEKNENSAKTQTLSDRKTENLSYQPKQNYHGEKSPIIKPPKMLKTSSLYLPQKNFESQQPTANQNQNLVSEDFTLKLADSPNTFKEQTNRKLILGDMNPDAPKVELNFSLESQKPQS